MFPPFTGTTSYRIRAPLALLFVMSCIAMHLFALLFIVFPLRYFSPVDSETTADVRVFDYIEDDSSFLTEQPGKPP